jgi:hypothetical protein
VPNSRPPWRRGDFQNRLLADAPAMARRCDKSPISMENAGPAGPLQRYNCQLRPAASGAHSKTMRTTGLATFTLFGNPVPQRQRRVPLVTAHRSVLLGIAGACTAGVRKRHAEGRASISAVARRREGDSPRAGAPSRSLRCANAPTPGKLWAEANACHRMERLPRRLYSSFDAVSRSMGTQTAVRVSSSAIRACRSICACDPFEPVDARSKAKHGTYSPLLAHRGADTARIEFVGDRLQLYRTARSNLCHDRCEFYCLRVGLHLARLRPLRRFRSLTGH